MSNHPVGILLAAGSSQRFGSDKLLHPVIEDTPMLLVSAKKLADALPQSLAVINKNLLNYKYKLEQLGLKVVVNENSKQGMGSSIACGVSHSSNASGWLITLADMPYIKTETLSLLANKLKERANIVVPVFEKQRGHPVGFSNAYKNELLALNQDVGARDIIKQHQEQLDTISTDDAGVIQDVDYKEDIT